MRLVIFVRSISLSRSSLWPSIDSVALCRWCSRCGRLAAVRVAIRARRISSAGAFRIQIWLPLVDALRTLLLAPTSQVGEILDDPWAHRHLEAALGT